MNNLNAEKRAIGSIIRAWLLTLLVLTLCTCSTPKLTLGSQTLGKQTDYSLYSGRLAKQTHDLMECATLKTVVQDFHLCLQQRPLTWRQLRQMHGTVSCLSLERMLRKCSQTRLYQYPSTTRSFSNPSRTVWTDPRPNLPIEYQPVDSLENPYKINKTRNYWRGSTPQSTGRTRVITPTMGRNLNSSSTMNRVNGKDRTISSTTGGLRKQR